MQSMAKDQTKVNSKPNITYSNTINSHRKNI